MSLKTLSQVIWHLSFEFLIKLEIACYVNSNNELYDEDKEEGFSKDFESFRDYDFQEANKLKRQAFHVIPKPTNGRKTDRDTDL